MTETPEQPKARAPQPEAIEQHVCEPPLDGLIQHRWRCKTCGARWEVVGMDNNGNPEWERIYD